MGTVGVLAGCSSVVVTSSLEQSDVPADPAPVHLDWVHSNALDMAGCISTTSLRRSSGQQRKGGAIKARAFACKSPAASMFTCPPVCLPACPPACLHACLPARLPARLSAFTHACPSVYLPARQPACPPICLPIHSPAWLPTCPPA